MSKDDVKNNRIILGLIFMKIRSLIGKKISMKVSTEIFKHYASSDASNLSSIVIKDIRKIYNLQPSNNLRIESQVVLI